MEETPGDSKAEWAVTAAEQECALQERSPRRLTQSPCLNGKQINKGDTEENQILCQEFLKL